ncbi:MAG: PAS domain S-box protein, partial [Desulfobacterales bacterium]
PVMRNNKAVAVLGVGNKPCDYTEKDMEVVSYLADVTWEIVERKKAEAGREQLLSAIEQTGEMIVITDTDGTIQYVNPAFEQITGYEKDEAIGQTPRILKSGRHDKEFYRDLWDTISGGDIWRGRIFNKRKDGTIYTEDATITPVLDNSGNIVNYVAVKHDITERLKLEDQLRQAQKMESVGRLAGGVAHDYNNMLSVIIGHSELAIDKTDPGDSVRSDLQEILNAGKRSSEITRQLLAFARKQDVSPVILDLNKTVEGMLKMLQRLIGEDIDIAWHPGASPGSVKIDPAQVDQLLANLCVNARDAIEGVGKLAIATFNAVFGRDYCARNIGFAPGRYVCLAVSDDGCGMDKATLENIFEPFFTTKDADRGTGLGLSTVYGIVKQNSGFINVYSEPGKGTTFRIYLPLHKGEQAGGQKQAEHEIPRGRGETILVAEDDASTLKMAQMALESLGYKVLTAATPAEALDLAKQHGEKIRLLVTDVIMPEMNGKELAGEIKSMYPGIRCLYMSGYTFDVITHRGVLDKNEILVQKPFSIRELAASVRKGLDAGN